MKFPLLTALALSLPLVSASAAIFTADTTIESTNVDYDGEDIIVSGCRVVVAGPHSFTSLLVTNGGTVTPPESASNRLDLTIAGDIVVATNSAIYGNARLVVQGQVSIAAGGAISANTWGYPVGTNAGPGTGRINPWNYGGGAGYGGPGGNGSASSGPSLGGGSYGSITEPSDLGSKGGGSGGAGGGAIRLEVAGTLQVDGFLSANGASAVVYYSSGGGGSGGSLWITAGTLAGSGVMAANGGDGDTFGYVGGGGGGGRIAIYCGTNSFTGTWRAWPGGGAMYGGPGSVFLKIAADALGELVFDAGGRSGVANPIVTTDLFRLTVSNSARVYSPHPLRLAGLRVGSGGVFAQSPATGLVDIAVSGDVLVATSGVFSASGSIVVTGNVTVAAGGVLGADGCGYPLGTNNGPGGGGVSPWYGGGAGHGGLGGNGHPGGGPAPGGTTYGSITQPSELGSRGGMGGGAGGGALRLIVRGALTVEGRLSANGDNAGYDSRGGGGSGGSLWIATDGLAGSGQITAHGGNGDSYNSVGGGGGGGRISLQYSQSVHTGWVTALGGAGAGRGGAGTIFRLRLPSEAGILSIYGGDLAGPVTPLEALVGVSTLIVETNAVVVSKAPLLVTNLIIGSGGTLTQFPGQGGIEVTALQDVTVHPGGRISADACGYFTSTNAGPGAGLTGGGGAGHGGNGGTKYTGVKGGPAYGSILWPTNYGSRGGDGTYGAGGAGGGAIKLSVGGTLTVNGRLSAEGGAVGGETAAGSGAGGSLLIAAQTLAGSGLISVNGGLGDYSYWYGGGGGAGGRIALRLTTNVFNGQMKAQGGAGKQRGGAGTTFTKLESEPFGVVRLENGITGAGVDLSYGGATPIVAAEPFHLLMSNFPLVTFPQPATFASLVVGSNVWITFPTNGVPLDLVVLSNATIAAGSQILADGFGYPIGGDDGIGSGASTNNVGSGAGHGGGGGIGSTGARAGRAYGSAAEPITFGSQGGPSSAGSGGAGGGVVRMTVGGTLDLQGRISANGVTAPSGNAGGGAGGSIYLAVGALTGTGPLWALGGAGNGVGGGAGGGRVSILGNISGFNTNNLLVTGGAGHQAGTNGTVHLGSYLVPRIVESRPTGFTTQAPDHFDVDFDQGIDATTLTADSVQVTGPSGLIPTAQLSVANVGGRTWRISFPPQTSNGSMAFTIAPGARSLFGLATTTAYAGGFEIRLERYLLPSRAGGTLRFDWATSIGRSYQLQSSTTLTNWSDLGPAWPGTGGMIGTNVPMSGAGGNFFRLQLFDN